MKLTEAIAVFDKSASRTTPNAQTEAWAVIRAELASVARYRWLRARMFVRRNEAVPDRYGLDEYLLSEGIEEPDDSRYIDAAIDAEIEATP